MALEYFGGHADQLAESGVRARSPSRRHRAADRGCDRPLPMRRDTDYA